MTTQASHAASTQTPAPLFDFAPFVGQSEHYVSLIKQFAQAHAFRSATVDELVLNDDFHRRPLRPEDFEFLKFMKPVRADNVSRLPSLAANRTLLSIYELDVLRAPQGTGSADWQRFSDFYRDDVRTLGNQIAPFLEAYAFSYLSSAQKSPDGSQRDTQRDLAAVGAQLRGIVDAELAFWDATFARLMRNDYLEEGLRFIMVQRWALAPSKRRTLALAAARGLFDVLPHDAQPSLAGGFPEESLLEKVAGACGVTRQQHAYWQFYLPTSTAKCNLLSALARRPGSAFGCAGAAFAAQAEWLAFGLALERACVHLQPAGKRPADAGALKAELVSKAERAFLHIAEQHGPLAYAQALQGLDAGETLADRGRWDLGEQLRWLSAIQRYCGFARQISARIDVECPDIDRETFVEPHEMCSTTHVHNDHRLVTIEEGEMLFWGNVGMQLKMNRGDMVLIPDGRLHGSTVVSGECTYHQPIIPDDWVQALTAELDSAPAR